MNLAIALLSTPRHLITGGYNLHEGPLSRTIPPDIADEIVRRKLAGEPWSEIEHMVKAAGVATSPTSVRRVWARYRDKD